MKHPLRGASPAVTALTLLMLVLLAVLAVLQYRWTGQVGIAEREQMRANVQSALTRYAYDFDRELTRALVYFLPSGSHDGGYDAALLARYDYWNAHAPHPELVQAVYLAQRDGDQVSLERLDPSSRTFEAAAWEGGLQAIRDALTARDGRRRDRGGAWDVPPVFDEVPALVVPFVERSGSGRHGEAPSGQPPTDQRFAVLRLDRDYIVEELLPLLTERYFGDGDYQLTVRRPRDRDEADAGRGKLVYLTGGSRRPRGEGAADAAVPLFGLLSLREFPALFVEAGHSSREFEALGRRSGGNRRMRGPAPSRDTPDRPWLLTATHRSGSLTAAIAAVRFRNLFVSFGVLVLLAGSVMLILVSARRAQDLARQRMEFVAGVSHELRTPLAVICSAGQNLADGVTQDAARVRDYGKLIRDEGRRLSDMVGQILEHASVQSGRKAYVNARVNVREVVEAALASCEPMIAAGGFTVDATYPDPPAEVAGDARALERAVQNLIVNAVKYSSGEAWIGIRVAAEPDTAGDRFSITVTDRGCGIEPSERSRIFEPFFRGAAAVADQIHGNGLGLSLVKQIVGAHGGTVSVVSATTGDGRGSAFTLHLPAAPEAPAVVSGRKPSAAADADLDDGAGQPARG